MTEWGPALAVILGIVEGLTEFLPVSSTGHLILVGHALGFTGDAAANAEISIQLGAILAVIVFEREKIVRLLSGAWQEQAALQTLQRSGQHSTRSALIRASMQSHPHLWFVIGLGLAFLPAASVGFLAHGWIKSALFTPQTVAATSIIGGLIILAVEARQPKVQTTQLDRVSIKSAFWVGVAQCASLIPGMSRSGSTIIGGLLSGLSRTFFCNSGTEAMEGCLKFARRYWHTAGDAQRTGDLQLGERGEAGAPGDERALLGERVGRRVVFAARGNLDQVLDGARRLVAWKRRLGASHAMTMDRAMTGP